MRYVVDASVALKWVLPEPDSAKALLLRDDFRNGIHDLLAPDIFPSEAAHGLVKAERRGIIPYPQGSIRLADILRTLPLLIPVLPDLLPKAYALASKERIGVYDCLYVATAERENCELITADDKLVRNLQKQFPFILSLASLP